MMANGAWRSAVVMACILAACTGGTSAPPSLAAVPPVEFDVERPLDRPFLEEVFALELPSASYDPHAGWVVIDSPVEDPSLVLLASTTSHRWNVHQVSIPGSDLIAGADVSGGWFAAVNHTWADPNDLRELEPTSPADLPYREVAFSMGFAGISYSPASTLHLTQDFETWTTSEISTLPWASPVPIMFDIQVASGHVGILFLAAGVDAPGFALVGGPLDGGLELLASWQSHDEPAGFAITSKGFVVRTNGADGIELLPFDASDEPVEVDVPGLLQLLELDGALVTLATDDEQSLLIDRWTPQLDDVTRVAEFPTPLRFMSSITSDSSDAGIVVGFIADDGLIQLEHSSDGESWTSVDLPSGAAHIEGVSDTAVLLRTDDDRWLHVPVGK